MIVLALFLALQATGSADAGDRLNVEFELNPTTLRMYDTNKNGHLEVEEFRILTAAQLDKALDANPLAKAKMKPSDRAKFLSGMEGSFRAIDRNHDNRISPAELPGAAENPG